MVRLDDTTTVSDNPSPSLNDLTALKNLQERERASTPVSIVVRRFTPFPTSKTSFSDIGSDG